MDYKKYIKKAFYYGFKLDHFKYLKLFEPIQQELMNDPELKELYPIARKKYLENIDF